MLFENTFAMHDMYFKSYLREHVENVDHYAALKNQHIIFRSTDYTVVLFVFVVLGYKHL